MVRDTEGKQIARCQAAIGKANRVFGCIHRGITCISNEVVVPLYRNLVRPHLEYCVQFWSLHLRKDIVVIERVPSGANRLNLGLVDLIRMFKMKGIDKISAE